MTRPSETVPAWQVAAVLTAVVVAALGMHYLLTGVPTERVCGAGLVLTGTAAAVWIWKMET